MVQSSLVGHWPLHEWSGRANDLSGNDNHSTTTDATQGVAGVGGLTGYSFNGSSDIVEADEYTSAGDDGTPTTVSLWVKFDSIQRCVLFGSNRDSSAFYGFSVGFDPDLGEGFIAGKYDGNSNVENANDGLTSPQTGKWYHIVYVSDGSTGRLYRDGELYFGDKDDVIITQDIYTSIGAESVADGGNVTDGSIADVRVYDRALSPSEVQYLYRVGSADVATPPAAGDSAAVSRYAFDDRSDTSTALDEWGSNDGTINGAVYSADAIRGLSMSFDGSNDYVDIPATFFDTDTWTLSAWFKTPQEDNFNVIFSTGSSVPYVEMSTTNSPNFAVYSRLFDSNGDKLSVLGQTDSKNVETDDWYKATAVRDGDTLRFYINGVLFATDTNSAVASDTSNAGANIGRKPDNTNHIEGEIDDVRIYDRALSDYEVQQLYLWGTRGTDRRYEVLQQ